jgi:caa(3)-type oxidase subunit IV
MYERSVEPLMRMPLGNALCFGRTTTRSCRTRLVAVNGTLIVIIELRDNGGGSSKPIERRRHMAAHSKKEYFVVFVVLTLLTAIEVAIKYLSISRSAMIIGLVGLALSKATCVALFYMHLKTETRALKLVITIPMLFPALYAVVLIAESVARSVFTL